MKARRAEVGANKPERRPAMLDPLSDHELEQLDTLLADSKLAPNMRIEELDGFFSGLLAGPPVPKPCQFWPVIFGRPVGDTATLNFIRTDPTLLPLFARHWDTIARELDREEIHVPCLLSNELGVIRGNDWARGFLRAVELNAEAWSGLLRSDEGAAALLPMMILAHEGDADPLLRPPALDERGRAAIRKMMAVGLVRANRHFAPAKAMAAVDPAARNLH